MNEADLVIIRLNGTATKLAKATSDSFSYDAYAPGEWERITEYLLIKLKFSPEHAESFLRSKHTRWARDCDNSCEHGEHDLATIINYTNRYNITADDVTY